MKPKENNKKVIQLKCVDQESGQVHTKNKGV